ncbi:MAG: aspartate aminotransferase family protein [Candidatus Aminicenantes bacterium]|nr:aspartate aminotransferase family protein [Candidatus Aminicenantes bacterium]
MTQYSKEEIALLKQSVKKIWMDFRQMQEFEQNPVIVCEGNGIKVKTIDGREFIDAISGAVVTGIGYSNEKVKEAIKKQTDELCWWPVLHATTPPALNLARLITELLPGDLNTAFLLSGGSEATECAMKMARQYHIQTGNPLKTKIVSRYWSYHGSTKGALSASGVSDKYKFDPFLAGHIHIFPPYCYRCPFKQSPEECDLECALALEQVIRYEGRDTVSAVIVDPVLAAVGILVPPKEYYRRIREICHKTDVLLVFDEVLTGFGRTGSLFACNHYDVVPDIICLGKGISGGYQPLAATVACDKVVRAFRGKNADNVAFMHGNTFGGHPIACAAGTAAIEELLRLNLVENSRIMGSYLREECLRLQEKYAFIGDVRGLGLLVGIEMVQDKNRKTLFPSKKALVPKLIAKAMERGIITRGSHHVWHLAPPLIITKTEIDEVVEILDNCMSEIQQEL